MSQGSRAIAVPYWAPGAAVALLLAAGPAIGWAGAVLAERGARAETVALDRQLAPRRAAEAARAQVYLRLKHALGRPTLGALAESVARALPEDSRVARMALAENGDFELEVSTPDPDRLRDALRRAPGLPALRDTGQRQAEAAIVVTMQGRVS